MAAGEKFIDEMREKYGARSIDNAMRLSPDDFSEMIEWRDALDPHYAKLWMDYTYGGLFARGVLDDRTRLLVGIAQSVAIGDLDGVEGNLRAALGQGATPREALEVILQAGTYVGIPKVVPAARAFRRIVTELGRIDEITDTQLPLDGHNAERSLEAERPGWNVPEEDFPRRQELMDKYGWEGISAGLRLQPTHHVEGVTSLDCIDQNFLSLWLKLIYAGLYVRGILDDKTRILCMVGICTVIDEQAQAYNHQRAALMFGASPREVLEVTLQSTIYCGMPRSLRGMRLLMRILEEQGRTAEITETQLPLEL
jgi:alkylhydroperoxidase/carboxymuconolactone decarboxylase family protein YurZ